MRSRDPSTVTTHSRTGRRLILAGFLTTAIVIVYWRAAGFGFANYDNDVHVLQNPWVRAGLTGPGLVPRSNSPCSVKLFLTIRLFEREGPP